MLSALFVNDTVCLMLTPVLLATLGPLGLRPVPYLIALAMGANIGSALTIVGNPQNMLVGLWSGIPFATFAWRMLPVVVGGMVIACGVLLFLYRKELAGGCRAAWRWRGPPSTGRWSARPSSSSGPRSAPGWRGRASRWWRSPPAP